MSSYFASDGGTYNNNGNNNGNTATTGQNANSNNHFRLHSMSSSSSSSPTHHLSSHSQQPYHHHQQQQHHHQQQNVIKSTSSANRKLSYESSTISATSKYSPSSSSTHYSSSSNAVSSEHLSANSKSNLTELSTIKRSDSFSPSYSSQKMSSTTTPQFKVSNYHLLDHGYGATPQPHYRDVSEKIIATSRNSEPTITEYYKQVKRRLPMSESATPISSKYAKQTTPATSATHPRHQLQHSIKVEATTTTPTTPTSTSSSKKRPPEGTRADTSLGILTKKFVYLLQESPDGVVDLNLASRKLEVQKRRIYDITNVLEGIGILEKKSKNNIQWKCGQSFVKSEAARQMELESKRLEQKENQLDFLIGQIRGELGGDSYNNNYAYVTHQDLRNIDVFKDQVVIVIKAPPEAKLVLPDAKLPREIHLKAENNGEINVYLCTDSPENSPTFSNDPLFNDIKPLIEPVLESTKKKLGTTYPFRSPQRNLNKFIMDAAAAASIPDENKSQGSRSSSVGDSNLDTDFIFPTTTCPVLTQSQVDLLSGTGSSSSSSRPQEFYIKQPKKDDNDTLPRRTLSPAAATLNVIDNDDRGGNGDGDRNNDDVDVGVNIGIGDRNDGCIDIINDNPLNNTSLAEIDSKSLSSVSTTSSNTGVAVGLKKDISINSSALSTHSPGEREQGNRKGVRNALISSNPASYSPGILPHVDQNYFDDLTPFLSIDPPLDLDYHFSLAPTEGLTDLFDFV